MKNPAGIGLIQIAELDGKIVGHGARIPVMMKVGAETVSGNQGIDAMTHPAYRRWGISGSISMANHAWAAKCNLHIGYGLSKVSSFSFPHGVSRRGSVEVAFMQVGFKVLHWENAARRRTSNKLLLKLAAIGGSLVDMVFFRAGKAPDVPGLVVR